MKFVSFASQLGPLVQEMGAEPVEFIIKTKRNPVDPINLLEGPGLDVELTQVAPTGGLLSYEGRQIVLYIPDQGSRIDEVLINGSQGKKVHVADCRTLDDMRKKTGLSSGIGQLETLRGPLKYLEHLTALDCREKVQQIYVSA